MTNKITNTFGISFDFGMVFNMMDADIRKGLVNYGFNDDQEFFDAYCAAHEKAHGKAFECAKKNPQVWLMSADALV